jgi:hypothetical protein
MKNIWTPFVRPLGTHRIGDTIRVSWAHTNITGKTQVENYLTLRLPNSVAINHQESSIGGPLRTETSLAGYTGTDILLGDIKSGETVWLDLLVTAVAPTAEGGDNIAVELRIGDNEPVSHKPVFIHIRAFPDIEVLPSQVIAQKAEEHRFGAAYFFRNKGAAPARDLLLRVPAPVGFIINRVAADGMTDNGDPIERELRLAMLEAGQEAKVLVEFAAGPDAVGDAVEVDDVVLSYHGGEVLIPALPLRLASNVDFSQSSLALPLEPTAIVKSGQLIQVVLRVLNTGRSDAKNVAVSFRLPHELIYASGTLAINDGVDARRDDLSSLTLPLVRGRSFVTVSFCAVVRSPIDPDTRGQIFATIDDLELQPLEFDIESAASFPLEENYVTLDDPTTISAGEPRTLNVRIHNAGTALSDDVRVRIGRDRLAIDRAIVVEDDGKETMMALGPVSGDLQSSIIDLGAIPPRETRLLQLVVGAPEAFENNSTFSVRAHLRTNSEGEEFEIGGVDFRGRSWPVISAASSEIRALREDEMRVGQHRILTIRLENTGSAKAEDVEVDLDLPATLTATHAEGAELTGSKLKFPPISPCSIAQATVRVEVTAAHDGRGTLELKPLVACPGMTAFRLKPITLITSGRSIIDNVRTEVAEVPASDRVRVTMTFTNTGDRAARYIIITLPTVPAGYVPGSTSIHLRGRKDKPRVIEVPDLLGTTHLKEGFVIPELDAGCSISAIFELNVADSDPVEVTFTIDSESQKRIVTENKRYRRLLQKQLVSDRALDLAITGPRIIGQYTRDVDELRRSLTSRQALTSNAAPEPSSPTTHDEPEHPMLAAAPEHDGAVSDAPASHGDATPEVPLAAPTHAADHLDDGVAPDAAVAETIGSVDPNADLGEPKEPALAEDPERFVITNTAAATDTVPHEAAGPAPAASEAVGEDATPQTVSEAEPLIAVPVNAGRALQPGRFRTHIISVDDGSAPRTAVPGSADFTAPVGRLNFDPFNAKKISHFLDLVSLRDNLGMYKHLIAMRVLLPQRLDGVSADVATQYVNIYKVARINQMRSASVLVAASFVPTESWAENYEQEDMRAAGQALLRIAEQAAGQHREVSIPPGTAELFGPVTFNYLTDYQRKPVGGGHFHRMLAELLPSQSLDLPDLGNLLAEYRTHLIDALDAFVYQGATPRHESLLRTSNPDLDRLVNAITDSIAIYAAEAIA